MWTGGCHLCILPWPRHSLPVVTRDELIHLSRTLNFFPQLSPRGLFWIAWSRGQQCLCCGLTEEFIFGNFKNCCLWGWLPISLNLGTDRSLTLDGLGTVGSWHTLNNWDLSRINEADYPITKFQETTKSWARLNDKFHLLHKATPSRWDL